MKSREYFSRQFADKSVISLSTFSTRNEVAEFAFVHYLKVLEQLIELFLAERRAASDNTRIPGFSSRCVFAMNEGNWSGPEELIDRVIMPALRRLRIRPRCCCRSSPKTQCHDDAIKAFVSDSVVASRAEPGAVRRSHALTKFASDFPSSEFPCAGWICDKQVGMVEKSAKSQWIITRSIQLFGVQNQFPRSWAKYAPAADRRDCEYYLMRLDALPKKFDQFAREP